MKTKILNGRELAGYIKERQAQRVRALSRKPRLLILRDGENAVIDKYVGLKVRYGEDVGVEVIDMKVANATELKMKLLAANDDPAITGIIVQLPIAEKDQTDEICDLTKPEKDVDGLGKNAKFDSATATAIWWLLSGYGIELADKKVAIVGRGKLVGAPLLKMCERSGIDVSLFHRGDDLARLRDYDVIISATGVPGLVESKFVKPGAVVVDAGTASEGGVIRGDADEKLYEREDLAAITPKLGGVGPLTVACLFEHVIEASSA